MMPEKQEMFAVSQEPVKSASGDIKFRKPFECPPDGNDPKFDYVTAIRKDAPFEAVTIGGWTFPKRVFPVDASLVENAGKYFEPKVPARRLTEKQAKAFFDRAKDVMIQVSPLESVCAQDYLIQRDGNLCKVEQFTGNPAFVGVDKNYEKAVEQMKMQQQLNEAQDEIARLKQALLEVQAKPGKKT